MENLSPEALLAWAVASAVKWYQVRLTNRPECCQQCNQSVLAENDVIGSWVFEHVERADGRSLEMKAAWSEFKGEQCGTTHANMKMSAFKQCMAARLHGDYSQA